jgi:hypothetical protein
LSLPENQFQEEKVPLEVVLVDPTVDIVTEIEEEVDRDHQNPPQGNLT